MLTKDAKTIAWEAWRERAYLEFLNVPSSEVEDLGDWEYEELERSTFEDWWEDNYEKNIEGNSGDS